MEYIRRVTSDAYGSRISPNHQAADDFWVAQGTDAAPTAPQYNLGGECFLQPGYDVIPGGSPTSQSTPPLTDGSPQQDCYQEDDFTQLLTPDEAAPISLHDPWAGGYFGPHPETTATIDPVSPAGHVDNHCLGGTVENEHITCHLDLSHEELNANMKLFLESVRPEPVPSSSTNITYPDSYSLGVNLSFGANHYIPSHLTDEPATTTCPPHAPADYSYLLSDPCTSVAQNVVAPYTHSHSSQFSTAYGANPLPSSYPLAAPAMEERGWHQQPFSPTYEQQPQTSTSRRHHRYNPYPQAPRAGPSASTSVSGMGSASPVASSSRLPHANLVDDYGHSVSASYPLSQTLGPDMEPIVEDDLENKPHYCQWGTCSAGPMSYQAILQHFREHAVITEDGKVKECLWRGCTSGDKFPMTFDGFCRRHLSQIQSHVGLVKREPCGTCGKLFAKRSLLRHKQTCPKLVGRVGSEKGKGREE